jgi:RNA polymerase sigma factor (sigma-70 family)
MAAEAGSDRELLARCAGGDGDAWGALVGRYRRLVYSVPVRFGFDESLSDEVFQRTFVSLLRAVGRLRDAERLAAWLAVTATNHCRMLLRERKRRAEDGEDPGEIPAPAEDVSEALRKLEEAQILRAGLERLDGRCRALLDELFFATGRRSYEEISRRLEMPIGSLGPTRARCLAKLKALLLDMGYAE